MKNMIKIFALTLAIVTLSYGQTAITKTTISAAMTVGQSTIVLASATGVSVQAGAGNEIITGLYVDREFLRVVALVSGTTYSVQRGQGSSRQTAHASGAVVWIGPLRNGPFIPGAIPETSEVSGGCTQANESYTARIYIVSGNRYTCMGIAPAGQWALVSSPHRPVLGAVVASPAGLLTPSGTVFHISGTNAITGFVLPPGWGSGMCLTIIPDAAFTTTNATNVAIASTGVTSKAMFQCWDDTTTKWYPSY